MSVKTAAEKNHLKCYRNLLDLRVNEKGVVGLYQTFPDDVGTPTNLYTVCLEFNHPFLLIAVQDYGYEVDLTFDQCLTRVVEDLCPLLLEHYLPGDPNGIKEQRINLNLLLCHLVDVLAELPKSYILIEKK